MVFLNGLMAHAKTRWVPWLGAALIAALGLTATYWAYTTLKTTIDQQAEARFQRESDRLKLALEAELARQQTLLQAAKGIFAADPSTGREAFAQ